MAHHEGPFLEDPCQVLGFDMWKSKKQESAGLAKALSQNGSHLEEIYFM